MENHRRKFKLTGRELRFLLYLAVLGAVAAWKFVPRPWKPALMVETNHYSIASTATPTQTEEIAQVVEDVYFAYSNLFHTLPAVHQPHPKWAQMLQLQMPQWARRKHGHFVGRQWPNPSPLGD